MEPNGATTESPRGYEDLRVWQMAFDLGLAAYQATSGFPDHERYGLTSQVRRSGVSIAANIAEGWGRDSAGDLSRFLRIARGSLRELETLLGFASRLSYLEAAEFTAIRHDCDKLGQALHRFIESVETKRMEVRESAATYGEPNAYGSPLSAYLDLHDF